MTLSKRSVLLSAAFMLSVASLCLFVSGSQQHDPSVPMESPVAAEATRQQQALPSPFLPEAPQAPQAQELGETPEVYVQSPFSGTQEPEEPLQTDTVPVATAQEAQESRQDVVERYRSQEAVKTITNNAFVNSYNARTW